MLWPRNETISARTEDNAFFRGDFPNVGQLLFPVRLRLFVACLLCFAEVGAAGAALTIRVEVLAFDAVRAQGTPAVFGKLLDQELFAEARRRVPGHERGFEILKGRVDWMRKHDLKWL